MIDYQQIVIDKLREFNSSDDMGLKIEEIETDLVEMYVRFSTKLSDVDQVDSLIRNKLSACDLIKDYSTLAPSDDGFYTGYICYRFSLIRLDDLRDDSHTIHLKYS